MPFEIMCDASNYTASNTVGPILDKYQNRKNAQVWGKPAELVQLLGIYYGMYCKIGNIIFPLV